jgi:hypothetical protein
MRGHKVQLKNNRKFLLIPSQTPFIFIVFFPTGLYLNISWHTSPCKDYFYLDLNSNHWHVLRIFRVSTWVHAYLYNACSKLAITDKNLRQRARSPRVCTGVKHRNLGLDMTHWAVGQGYIHLSWQPHSSLTPFGNQPKRYNRIEKPHFTPRFLVSVTLHYNSQSVFNYLNMEAQTF